MAQELNAMKEENLKLKTELSEISKLKDESENREIWLECQVFNKDIVSINIK